MIDGLQQYIGVLKTRFDTFFGAQKQVVVGLSGGVDSAVALYLIKELGLKSQPIYVNVIENPNTCRSAQDYLDALAIASYFGLKLEFVDYSKEYERMVLEKVTEQYSSGLTPNPDILCNSAVKMPAFSALAGEAVVVTGHYASVVAPARARNTDDMSFSVYDDRCISQPLDFEKDQTYFLAGLIQNQDLINNLFFPLEGLLKTQVRTIAKNLQLKVFDKPDSQGVCLIGTKSLKEFLNNKLKPQKGLVKNFANEIVGTHEGAILYTIGQRHGFEIKKYNPTPLYIVAKDVISNTIIVGDRDQCFKSCFKISEPKFANGFGLAELQKSIEKKTLKVRIRNLGELYPVVSIASLEDGMLEISTNSLVFAITPGQAAVFYTPLIDYPIKTIDQNNNDNSLRDAPYAIVAFGTIA